MSSGKGGWLVEEVGEWSCLVTGDSGWRVVRELSFSIFQDSVIIFDHSRLDCARPFIIPRTQYVDKLLFLDDDRVIREYCFDRFTSVLASLPKFKNKDA